MRVLVIEDDEELAEAIGVGLRRSEMVVDVASEGSMGLARALENDYDVIVLDIMLPGLDGLTVLRRLREKGVHSGVLLLTAKDTIVARNRSEIIKLIRNGKTKYRRQTDKTIAIDNNHYIKAIIIRE